MLLYNIFLVPESLIFYGAIVIYLVFFVGPLNNELLKEWTNMFKQREKDAKEKQSLSSKSEVDHQDQ